jgi:hypothetical protein
VAVRESAVDARRERLGAVRDRDERLRHLGRVRPDLGDPLQPLPLQIGEVLRGLGMPPRADRLVVQHEGDAVQRVKRGRHPRRVAEKLEDLPRVGVGFSGRQ